MTDIPTTKVRVLKPFRFRPMHMQRGVMLPLDDVRIVEPGERIELPLPDARSLAATGKVQLLTSNG